MNSVQMSSDDSCSLAGSSACFDDDEDFSSVHSASKNNEKNQEASKQAPAIAKTEDRWVSRSRFLVFLVLAGAASTVGILTYRFLKDDQQEEFENDVSCDNDDKMTINIHDSILTFLSPSSLISFMTRLE
jgi:hypothetical protein